MKRDHEVGNYFYNKRLQDGTLHEKVKHKVNNGWTGDWVIMGILLLTFVIIGYTKS